MNCPNDEKLAAFSAGDLPEEEQQQIEKHLGHCRSCQSEQHRFEQLLDTLNDRERPDVDSAFVQRVMNETEYHLFEEQPRQTNRVGWFPLVRIFVRRNAPWIASLSLHCCLIFLVLLLAVNQFTGSESQTQDEDVLTGVPVISTDDNSEDGTYRERILWKEQLRRMRTGKTSAEDAPCPNEPSRDDETDPMYRTLVSSRTQKTFWTDTNEGNGIKPTSLAVLALLRGGHLPRKTGDQRSVAAYEGLTYLISQQQKNGRVGPDDAPFSVHATATAALLEARLFTSNLDFHRSALNALEYLTRTRSANPHTIQPNYWTVVSLKLGETLNHPKAGELLRTLAQENGNRSDVEIPADLMVRPFLDASALSNRQRKLAKSLLDHWTGTLNKNETPVLKSDQAVALSHLVFTMNDPGIRWTDVREKLKKRVKLDSLERPSRIARYALILQICRSYPR